MNELYNLLLTATLTFLFKRARRFAKSSGTTLQPHMLHFTDNDSITSPLRRTARLPVAKDPVPLFN